MQPSPLPAKKCSVKRYCLIETVPFVAAHLVCFAALWTGVHVTDLIILAGLYGLRMFGITAGYHRYFAHRGFKTSRLFAFFLAFLAQSAAQRGTLWWAASHRQHHLFSDTRKDPHSPDRHGFWHAHLGWFFAYEHRHTDYSAISDFAKYPELVWLNRYHYVPAIVTGFLVWLAAGWSGLVVGFFWSTVILWHATFSINSLAHVIGRQRYETGDQSRNNLWLALLTFGEGWHNNHHHYQSAARQGFRWYEIDVSFYLLKGLALLGLVADLRSPPARVVRNEQRLGRAVIEKAASQLAASFQAERIASDLQGMLAKQRASLNASFDEFSVDLAALIDGWRHQVDEKAENARLKLQEALHTIQLPVVPTMAEFRARADVMFLRTPSMNEIVERGRQILLDDVFRVLLERKTALSPAGA